MGMDFHVYVGAYLEIEADPVPVKGSGICPRGHRTGGGKFCQECGAQLVSSGKTRPARLWDITDTDDLSDAIGEGGPETPIIAIGNKEEVKDLPNFLRLVYDETFHQEIQRGEGEQLIANFKGNYAQAIAELEKRARSVKVQFGVVGWWS